MAVLSEQSHQKKIMQKRIFLLRKIAFNKIKLSRHGKTSSASRTRGKMQCIAITTLDAYSPNARKKVQLYHLR